MSTASQLAAAADRKPRTRPAPSPRDQQIYLDYQTTGQLQSELATQYGLTQCRVSQIIRRVEKWLNSTGNSGPGAGDAAARESLERRLQSERLNSVCRQAMRHYHEQQKSVTHKKGTRAGKDIDETTERLLPPNVQCLKVVLQANNQLSRLKKLAPQQDRRVGPASPDAQRREQVEAWLTRRREEAARAGRVPRYTNTDSLIQDLVSALLGEPNQGCGLGALASDCGKKIVDPKSYEVQPPPVPPHNGWYYPMHDAHGTLVAWLSADQLAGAISPDYQPMSRSPIEPCVAVVGASPDPAPATNSTTSPPVADPSQPACSPALTLPSQQLALTLNDQGLSAVMNRSDNCGVV